MKCDVWYQVGSSSLGSLIERLLSNKRLYGQASSRLGVPCGVASPEGICRVCQVAVLLPGSQLILQGEALLLIPAVETELPDA